jgi:hypothetical protein
MKEVLLCCDHVDKLSFEEGFELLHLRGAAHIQRHSLMNLQATNSNMEHSNQPGRKKNRLPRLWGKCTMSIST